jgi:hypothetical protein
MARATIIGIALGTAGAEKHTRLAPISAFEVVGFYLLVVFLSR